VPIRRRLPAPLARARGSRSPNDRCSKQLPDAAAPLRFWRLACLEDAGTGQSDVSMGTRPRSIVARQEPVPLSITQSCHEGDHMRRSLFAVTGITLLALSLSTLVGVAQTKSAAAPRSTRGAKVVATSPVNLNTATSAELETLPNIGPAAAARIIEYRQKNGGFKKIEDLMNVKGIGEKRFLKLKPLVSVTPAKASEE
jgi:comEA protein